jgi:hypothetical protein
VIGVTAAATTDAWWFAPAVIAAVIAAAAGVFTLWVNGRRARVDRQRVVFADAFAVVAEYREYPYIVRRRRHDDPEGERARINTALSEVQHRLTLYTARLKVEDEAVGAAFQALVDKTREIAGGEIRRSWTIGPVTTDAGMSIGDVDLSGLAAVDDEYLATVRKHLGLKPNWM